MISGTVNRISGKLLSLKGRRVRARRGLFAWGVGRQGGETGMFA